MNLLKQLNNQIGIMFRINWMLRMLTILSKIMFTNACDIHCPIKEKRVKGSFPEWINGDYIKLWKDRDYYFSRAHKFNNDNDWKRARQLRNETNKLNRSLKKNYCNKAINENVNNSKKLWSTIKKLIPKYKSSVSSVHTQDGFTANDKETADQFNSFSLLLVMS